MIHSKRTLLYYFLLSLILGSGLHFLYTLLPSPLTALVAPISESIWEHAKIIYWPYLLLSLIYSRHSPSAIGSFLFALPIMCLSMLTIGSIYHIVFGLHALWFDLLLVVMAFGFWFPAHCSIPSKTPLWYLGIIFTGLFGVLILLFTFFPPTLILFQDLSSANR